MARIECRLSLNDWNFFLQIVQAWKKIRYVHSMKYNLSIVVFFYEKCRYRSAFIAFEGQTNTFPYVDHIFDKTIHHLDVVMGSRRNAQFFLATGNGRIVNCLIVLANMQSLFSASYNVRQNYYLNIVAARTK